MCSRIYEGRGREQILGIGAQDRHPGLIPAWSRAGTRTKHPHEHPSHTSLSQLACLLSPPLSLPSKAETTPQPLPKHLSTRRCWKAGWCLMPTKSFRKTMAPEGQPAAGAGVWSGGSWGGRSSSLKRHKRAGLQGRVPQLNPGGQVLRQNHTKARREETRSSFQTVPSLWIIFFPGSPTEIEKKFYKIPNSI